MAKNPETAECFNCAERGIKRKYDYYYHKHGGILGRCNQCDSDYWIITKDEMIAMNMKKKKGVKK
jgi:hypothetical protein